MIRRLAEKYPNEVHIISQGDSAIEATLPKSWVKIRPPRQLTDEQREALVQRGRELYARMAAQNPQ